MSEDIEDKKTSASNSHDDIPAEEKERLPGVMLNTVQLLGSRATFIGGFSYYSIGRYQYSCCASKPYIVFNTIAFVFSLMCAGTAGIFSYYLQRHKTPEEKYKFCMDAIQFERLTSQFYVWTVTTYFIGIGLLGFSYYPSNDLKWFPFVAMVFACGAYWSGVVDIIKKQFRFQTNFGSGDKEWLVDEKKIVEESPYNNRTGELLEDFVMKQASVVSGRAIFIAGLAQNGIMRFMPDPVEFSLSNSGADTFLVFISLASALSFTTGSVLSVVQVFIPDTHRAKQTAYTVTLMPLIQLCMQGYIFSFFSMFVANTFVSFGCNYKDMHSTTYIVGGVAILLLVLGCYRLRNQLLEFDAMAASMRDKKSDGEDIKKNTWDLQVKEQQLQTELQREMSAINTAGSMSTFAAGYLFYNIVTLETDVLRLDGNDEDDKLVRLFLFANMFTITFALLSAVQDTLLTLVVNYMTCVGARLRFIRSQWFLCHSCVWYYHISLLGWFVVFALFGIIKYSRRSYVPLIYASCGVFVVFSGTMYLSWIRKRIVSGGLTSHNSRNSFAVDDESVSISRPALLSSIAFAVIFLGGFAYFAVNFFNFNDRKYEVLYLHAMSISFMISMWVMVFADRYNYQMTKISTKAAKLAFTKHTYYFYIFTVLSAYGVVVSLLIGFSVLGNVKSISNYRDVDGVIFFSVIGIMVIILPFIAWVIQTFWKIKYDKNTAKPVNDATSSSVEKDENVLMIERWKSQILSGNTTAGYIAGNVCYEILFSDASSDYDLSNKFYFLMMTLTFALGVSAVILSTVAILCLGELGTIAAKVKFMKELKYLKLVIFTLSVGCLLAWQTTVIPMADVKYSGNKAITGPNVVLGFSGFIFLIYVLRATKCVSDGILYDRKASSSTAVENGNGTTSY